MKLAKEQNLLHFTIMSRLSIYQLFVRHFANFKEEQVFDGSLEENGCGKFVDINDEALARIADMGINTVWLTGMLEHATSTTFPGIDSDPTSILKGKAGSPYAIRDYFDVAPSLATTPETRHQEFAELIERTHKHGLKALIDFVPNHVARSYSSDLYPEFDFGANDQSDRFFQRDNDFYYIKDAEDLTLPNGETFPAEHGAPRVSGNNITSASPCVNDWYETAKLNYGYDFRDRASLNQLDGIPNTSTDVPAVWKKMQEVLLYWANKGIDGVRCDMAHMVPTQFWAWVIYQVRQHFPDFTFIAEAYQDDPMGCLPNWSLTDLTQAGFDAYYDQDLYHQLKAVVENTQNVESLNVVFFDADRQQHGIRYIENHDEKRVANSMNFGNHDQNLAAFASAILTGNGPVMLYNGQEVGEPAVGATGFSSDDGRSSIFDYTNLPELQKWTSGGAYDGAKLSAEQRQLRSKYIALIRASRRPEFQTGETYGLNYLNPHLTEQRVFAFLRYTPTAGYFLVVACFAENKPNRISIMLSADVLNHIGLAITPLCATSIMNGDQISQHPTEHGKTWLDIPMTESVNIVSLLHPVH